MLRMLRVAGGRLNVGSSSWWMMHQWAWNTQMLLSLPPLLLLLLLWQLGMMRLWRPLLLLGFSSRNPAVKVMTAAAAAAAAMTAAAAAVMTAAAAAAVMTAAAAAVTAAALKLVAVVPAAAAAAMTAAVGQALVTARGLMVMTVRAILPRAEQVVRTGVKLGTASSSSMCQTATWQALLHLLPLLPLLLLLVVGNDVAQLGPVPWKLRKGNRQRQRQKRRHQQQHVLAACGEGQL
jgi:hypothetical protein